MQNRTPDRTEKIEKTIAARTSEGLPGILKEIALTQLVEFIASWERESLGGLDSDVCIDIEQFGKRIKISISVQPIPESEIVNEDGSTFQWDGEEDQ